MGTVGYALSVLTSGGNGYLNYRLNIQEGMETKGQPCEQHMIKAQ